MKITLTGIRYNPAIPLSYCTGICQGAGQAAAMAKDYLDITAGIGYNQSMQTLAWRK
ncbi:MAG TPA: hypothetical protein P5315_02930 [Clostridia bacterium]|nr:hypothetical protein [Clostridia bacterium]